MVEAQGLTCNKDCLPIELDILFGAWVAGLGFILVLLGLSVWGRATFTEFDVPSEAEQSSAAAE